MGWRKRGRQTHDASLAHDRAREAEREAMYAYIRDPAAADATYADYLNQLRDWQKAKTQRDKAARKRMAKVAEAIARKRAVDTLDLMRRQGNIDRRQWAAASMYRDAWLASHGAVRCVLNQDSIGTSTTTSPLPRAMRAAAVLNQVRTKLGLMDDLIIRMIIVEGETIVKTAALLFGPAAGRAKAEHVGQRFRLALDVLANVWIPTGRGRMNGMRSHDTGVASSTSGTVKPGKVAHAAAGRSVHMSGRRIA